MFLYCFGTKYYFKFSFLSFLCLECFWAFYGFNCSLIHHCSFSRVQREQLAAIFQLLRDNKETFGDVSQGDMEEQLRLYSI